MSGATKLDDDRPDHCRLRQPVTMRRLLASVNGGITVPEGEWDTTTSLGASSEAGAQLYVLV